MAFIMFTKDQQAVYISISYKNVWKLLLACILLLLVVGGVGGYLYYKSHIYDSSTAKSELADFTPPPVSKDIKKQIQIIEKQKPMQATNSATTKQTSGDLHVASISAVVQVPIMMYHYVEYVQNKNDKTRISLNTTPYILENEIQTLIAAHYNFITESELADVLDGKSNLPANPIMLTFDDGYRDFYTDAYPILKKYHVKATQYVISGFLNRQNHLLTSQLQEIANDGLVEIGAHTVNHTWLKGISLKTASDEVFQSRVILEQIIHKPVISFAYPFGAFDDQAIQIVKAAGFKSAVSTVPGVMQGNINRFFLFRLRPGGLTGQGFLSLIRNTSF